MSSHQTKTISSRLCRGQAALDVSRFWTQARLSEEVKPKLLLNCAASANSREDRGQSGAQEHAVAMAGSSRDAA